MDSGEVRDDISRSLSIVRWSLERDRLQTCIENLFAILESDPQHIEATNLWIGTIDALKQQQRRNDCHVHYVKILQIASENPDLQWHYGDILERDNNLKEALEKYKKAASLNETSYGERYRGRATSFYFNEGIDCYKNRNWRAAIEAFDKVLRIDPNHEDAKNHLKKAQLEQRREQRRGQFEEAERNYSNQIEPLLQQLQDILRNALKKNISGTPENEAVLTENPNSPWGNPFGDEPFESSEKQNEKNRKLEQEAKQLEYELENWFKEGTLSSVRTPNLGVWSDQACMEFVENNDRLIQRNKQRVCELKKEIYTKEILGEKISALRNNLDSLREEYESNRQSDERRRYVIATIELGVELCKRNQLQSAYLHFRRVNFLLKAEDYDSISDALSNALCKLVEAYYCSGNLNKARQAYEKLSYLQIEDSSSVRILLAKGNCLLAQNQLQEAIESFKNALNLEAESWQAHLGLGRAQHYQGRWIDASLQYLQALLKATKLKEAKRNEVDSIASGESSYEGTYYEILCKEKDVDAGIKTCSEQIKLLLEEQDDLRQISQKESFRLGGLGNLL